MSDDVRIPKTFRVSRLTDRIVKYGLNTSKNNSKYVLNDVKGTSKIKELFHFGMLFRS